MRPTEKQPQSQDTQSTEQQSPSTEEKQLTLEELASVTGGLIAFAALAALKMEDKDGNKGEAG